MTSATRAGVGAHASRIGAINGLRGLAILAVIYHHLFGRFTPPGSLDYSIGGVSVSLSGPLYNGWLGVNLFFLLSGFVLMLPYERGDRELLTRRDVFDFYRRRWRRLMPLYYFSVLISAALLYRPDPSSGEILADAFFMATASFNLVERLYFPPYNIVLWSLGLEIWFSALFPALVWAARRLGLGALTVAVLAASLATRMLGEPFSPGAGWNPYLNFVKDSLPGRLDDFVLGMLLCQVFVRRGQLGSGRALLACALGVLAVASAACTWDAVVLGRVPRALSPFLNSLVGLGFFALGWGALSLRAGVLRRMLSSAPLQVVGMMCYSLYVWHALILFRVLPNRDSYALASVVLYLALVALVGALSYRYVEFGGQRDWRALFRGAPA